jgi:hypothetical protein
MFYLLTGITALLGLIVIGCVFIVKNIWIKIFALLVGLACLSYAAYLLFFLEEYIVVTFPIFALALPVVTLILEVIFRKKKIPAKHSVKNNEIPTKVKKVKPKIETRSVPLTIPEPKQVLPTPTLPPVAVASKKTIVAPDSIPQEQPIPLKLPPKNIFVEKNTPPVNSDPKTVSPVAPKPPVTPLLPARSKSVIRELNESEQAEKDKFKFPF